MVIQRGEVRWANLALETVVALAVTSNLRLLDSPGNVLLSSNRSGPPKDSVANVSQIATIDRDTLTQLAGQLGAATMTAIGAGDPGMARGCERASI
ncbi:MAG: type II toxin-antitoxin system PemK/MazF family toxin [bacterium]